jgi:hypothetical protein
MNLRLLFLADLLAVTLFALTGIARADRNPDFDEDATPILSRQPQLVEYVHHHFDVKATGTARISGNEEHPPQPPFIFLARPRASDGPYYLRLLVQPGAPGHILKVVDLRTAHLTSPSNPSAASLHSVGASPAPGSVITAPSAPAASTTAPTADTPSGPIPDSSATPSLAPPADPAPAP